MNLTNEEFDTLRHMLGINTPDKREPAPYRDYYCASPNDRHMHDLVQKGAVRMYSRGDGYEWYCTTDAGRAAALKSFKSIRYSKSKRIYRKFLELRECWPDLKFKEFITNPKLRGIRENA